MPNIKVVPLGAGQDVGRSCILVSIGGRNVMLDCGMHMGFQDDRRFPDFSYVNRAGGTLDEYISCVIISHFHLDHCGALPYMSEMVGYSGPIYMTHPTKAICPVLLEDYRKIQVEKKGDSNFFTSEMIKNCMRKVITVNLHETVQVDPELEIKPYYAGHVLGAAMFHVRVGSESFVYTGDYNMTPDRHLGAAEIDHCRPDLLISESTYATTIRDSKRARERDFLKKVHECVSRGGKVLIPVFALGRAQELCILLDTYWERMDLKVPIYFSGAMAEKANNYYKLFISWTNEKIKRTFVQRNMFDFKHITQFDRDMDDMPGPCVLFATPGMLHSGLSLKMFKKWAPDEKNMVIMPGYCVAGTVGHQVINGAKRIFADGGNREIEVKLSVEYMSFSAHADAKGIMQLIRNCQPSNLLFVHGEKEKMEFLKAKVQAEFGLQVFNPANGESVEIPTKPEISVDVSRSLLKRSIAEVISPDPCPSKRYCPFEGTLIMQASGSLAIKPPTEALRAVGLKPHVFRFTARHEVVFPAGSVQDLLDRVYGAVAEKFPQFEVSQESSNCLSISDVKIAVTDSGDDKKQLKVTWTLEKERIGSGLIDCLKRLNL